MNRKIIIVEDHELFRNGIKLLLNESRQFEEIFEASNGEELMAFLSKNTADLVLMDINMPKMNGIEATQKALELCPTIKIIALSMLSDEDNYYKIIRAGAKGFVLKDAGINELLLAIETVLNGNNYFSHDLVKKIIHSLKTNVRPPLSGSIENNKFSSRELEVLEQICKGCSNQEIADTLFISPRTVERHRANLFEKSGSKNAVNLVMFAIKNNLISV